MATWLEVTNRPDLGANLKAPQKDDAGKEYWSYALLKDAKDGDTVFHYHKPAQAIVAASRVVGTLWSEPIVWGARGTTARIAKRAPHSRLGWYIGLEDFRLLPASVSLDEIRNREGEIRRIRDELPASSAAYFPFAISDKRPLRPSQGYLMRWPEELNAIFLALRNITVLPARRVVGSVLGADYRAADEETAVSDREPFQIDPALVERGIRGHAVTQNMLAAAALARGNRPRSPSAGEPNYDLAWQSGGTIFVAEVKSLTTSNEDRQLRLGLGQVLHYAHLARESNASVIPVLAVEHRPTDRRWERLCSDCGVRLVWPPDFDALFES